jgi:hypothetical protein
VALQAPALHTLPRKASKHKAADDVTAHRPSPALRHGNPLLLLLLPPEVQPVFSQEKSGKSFHESTYT